MSDEISAAELAGQYGADAGGYHPLGAARNPIAAYAVDPSPAVPGRIGGRRHARCVPPSNSAPAASSQACGGRAFWEAVTSGALRLTADEDRYLASARTRRVSFDKIAARIMRDRARCPKLGEKSSAGWWRAAQRRARIRASVAALVAR